MRDHPGVTFTPGDLARRLKIKMQDRRRLKRSLKTLSGLGQITQTARGDRYLFLDREDALGSQRPSLTVKVEKTLRESIDQIIAEIQLPTDFTAAVEAEADAISTKISKDDIVCRRDLRSHVTVTIDGEKARDFDDAVSIADIGRNRIRLLVSIADVSHYVGRGTALDKEARARGTSVYFPDRVLPMLPEKLSNQVCSLVPQEDRLAFTAEIDFGPHGEVLRTEFYKSVIRSDYRLTYKQVAQALVERDRDVRHELRHIISHLELMEKLFYRLRETRLKRGSLDFDLPEPEIIMDLAETRIENIVKAERTRAHMMIEEFMIAANEAVARFITGQGAPCIYRIHEPPTHEKIKDLQSSLHNLGYSLRVSKKKFDPRPLAAIIEKAHHKTESRMINTLLLRSLAKAIYSVDNLGHFGLASTCYCHFTSPIRRYPDLIVHRILAELLDQEAQSSRSSQKKRTQAQTLSFDLRRLEQVAAHCSIRERVAMEAEWAVRDVVCALFMGDHIGQSYAGIISNVTKFGIFIELNRYFVEGLIHIRNLDDDYYHFLEETHTLVGRRTKKKYRIGDPVWIRVKGTNIEKRWVDFELGAGDPSLLEPGP